MIGKLSIILLSIPLALLLVFMVFYDVPSGQQSGERVEKGQYSLRRAATPEFLVTGVSLDDLSKARFSNMNKITEGLAGQFGRVRNLFDRKSKKQVKITVAVYGSVNEAEDAALDLLNSVSAVMKTGSQSGDVIGTHSWYLKSPDGSETIVFIHNNSLFQLFSSDYNLAESSARLIVDDLTRGTNGIRLGKQVILPEITDVKFPERLEGMREISLILEGQDPYQQKISFAVSASRGQLLETKKSGEKIYIPYEAGSVELKIYAINEMNVVSQVYIKKIEVEKEK